MIAIAGYFVAGSPSSCVARASARGPDRLPAVPDRPGQLRNGLDLERSATVCGNVCIINFTCEYKPLVPGQ